MKFFRKKRRLIFTFLLFLSLLVSIGVGFFEPSMAEVIETEKVQKNKEIKKAEKKEITKASEVTPAKPLIHYVKVVGVVSPVMGEYLIKSLRNAALAEAELVVIEIDTPGGLDLSMRDIVKAILASEVPVVLYVAPSGARAASAGVFISYASHIAAMAPGTNIGSASPVMMGGGEIDETMKKKITNDAVAYIKGIANKRGRNATWAESAVRDSVNITAEEALELKVIDVLADSRKELFLAINGMKVETITGTKTLNLKDAEVKEIEMGLRFSILDAIANPNVAYILMMLGMMGLYFELSNPGVIFPGVVGAICLVLAFYSLQTLSVNYAGLILIGLGIVFFIAELQIMSFGLLALAGVVSLTLGSLMLFDSPAPFMRVSLLVVLPVVLLFSATFMGAMYFVLNDRKRPALGGATSLVGVLGKTASLVGGQGEQGKVFIEGEYWNAYSETPIDKDESIRVLRVEGLLVKVEKI
ncbi:MAG: nodulation protein NfeD [Deltaproteobacteria bacterium]|nr:nodulation protein NfeD [Deltaproteobacteria bacterium]